MEHIGKLPSTLCNVAFDSVCKSVHTCCSSKTLWHCFSHIRVNESNYRDIVRVNTNHLSVLFNVCNNVVDCNFSSSTGCCRNCENRHALVLCISNAFKASYISKFRVCDDDTDSLCCVHRRTAADCNNVVSACCLDSFNASLYILNCWVRLDVGENFVSKTCTVKNVSNLLCKTELDKVRVGANESLLEASALCFVSNCVDSTCAVVGSFVENKSVHSFQSPSLFYSLLLKFGVWGVECGVIC